MITMLLAIICVHFYEDSTYTRGGIKVLIKSIPNFTKFFAYNVQSSQYKRMLFSGRMTNNIVHNTLQFELEINKYWMKNGQVY